MPPSRSALISLPVDRSRVLGEWTAEIMRGLVVLVGLALNNLGWLSTDPATQGAINALALAVGLINMGLVAILIAGRAPSSPWCACRCASRGRALAPSRWTT